MLIYSDSSPSPSHFPDVIKNVRVDEFTTECVKNVKFQIFLNIVLSAVGTEEAIAF